MFAKCLGYAGLTTAVIPWTRALSIRRVKPIRRYHLSGLQCCWTLQTLVALLRPPPTSRSDSGTCRETPSTALPCAASYSMGRMRSGCMRRSKISLFGLVVDRLGSRRAPRRHLHSALPPLCDQPSGYLAVQARDTTYGENVMMSLGRTRAGGGQMVFARFE